MKKILAVLILILVLPLASSDWKYQTKEKVYNFRILDYDGDDKEEIAVGSDSLYIIDFEGNLLKKFKYPGYAFDFSKVYLVNSFAIGGKNKGYLVDYLGNLKFEYPLDDNAKFVLIRDIDSDSRKEIIFATEDKIYILYRNGNLKISRSIPEIKKLECKDTNDDGDLEFIVAADKFYLLDKDLNTIWHSCDETNTFLINDFDGDDTEEIVLAGEELLFYNYNGLLYWKEKLNEEAVGIFLGDFDSDGFNEIVVFGESKIFAYDKEGTKKGEFEYPTYKNLNVTYIDDLDGDGTNEVILGIENHIIVLENEKKVADYSTTYSSDEISKIRTKDVDNDGKKEIIASTLTFLNVLTYIKQTPEEIEEEKEEVVDIEAKKTQANSLYMQGGSFFNNKNYKEAKTKFTQAKSLYEEIGDTEMVNVCNQFISKAYQGINGDTYFSEAQTKEEEGDYEGAIQSYETAKAFYSEIDQEKTDLCTQKINELKGEKKGEESNTLLYLGVGVPVIIFILIVYKLLTKKPKRIEKRAKKELIERLKEEISKKKRKQELKEKKIEKLSPRMNYLLKRKEELNRELEELKKHKYKLISQKIMTEETYKKRYEEIMDKLVDIGDKIIQEKMKGGKKK